MEGHVQLKEEEEKVQREQMEEEGQGEREEVAEAEAPLRRSPTKEITTSQQLKKNHSNPKNRDGNKKVTCSCRHCSAPFASKTAHYQHYAKEHSMERPVKCEHCDMRLATTTQLHNHRKVHFKPSNPFQCPICTRTFPLKFTCSRHLAKTHPGQVKLVPPKQAGFQKKKKGNLNCPVCQVRFEWTRHTYNRKAKHVPCGHISCLGCITTTKSGCVQCPVKGRLRPPPGKRNQRSRKGSLIFARNGGPVTRRVTQHNCHLLRSRQRSQN